MLANAFSLPFIFEKLLVEEGIRLISCRLWPCEVHLTTDCFQCPSSRWCYLPCLLCSNRNMFFFTNGSIRESLKESRFSVDFLASFHNCFKHIKYPKFYASCFKPSDGGNITSSTLRFRPKVEDMGKLLRCRAENPVMPASQIEDTWTLDINCELLSIYLLKSSD